MGSKAESESRMCSDGVGVGVRGLLVQQSTKQFLFRPLCNLF